MVNNRSAAPRSPAVSRRSRAWVSSESGVTSRATSSKYHLPEIHACDSPGQGKSRPLPIRGRPGAPAGPPRCTHMNVGVRYLVAFHDAKLQRGPKSVLSNVVCALVGLARRAACAGPAPMHLRLDRDRFKWRAGGPGRQGFPRGALCRFPTAPAERRPDPATAEMGTKHRGRLGSLFHRHRVLDFLEATDSDTSARLTRPPRITHGGRSGVQRLARLDVVHSLILTPPSPHAVCSNLDHVSSSPAIPGLYATAYRGHGLDMSRAPRHVAVGPR